MIKNLLFDMGGVILPMRPMTEPVRRFGELGLTPQLAGEYFGRTGQRGIFRQVEDGSLSAEAFLEAYEQLTGYRAGFADIEWAWRGFVHATPPDRLACLRELRAEGYHLALVSNTNPFLQRWAESAAFSAEGKGIGDFFDRLWYSYELKAYKPDALFFERLLKAGGYNAEECLFLDDSEANVQAARHMGVPSLHVPDNQDWMIPLRQCL
ncbi:MAG: HAD family phosphatase [Bacteroidaceae bacterium]|nr:HAD family phosphatase [Prevotellaceae bacterium]MDY5632756.1 HAD family phosphatase [Bacteroidaceae bacterium]